MARDHPFAGWQADTDGMKHWRLDDVAWDRFDRGKVDPAIVPLVKAAAMVERNGTEYAVYLSRVFHDDPDFQQAAERWSIEEVQHGDALGQWASLADPDWSYQGSFQRYRNGFKLPLDMETSVRGSRTGELIARCMVETGTSSYYTALADATDEPVLREVCRLIAADEYRHFKLFYDHMRRYLARENISFSRRLRIALSRVSESEDDELAYAYHCSNEPASIAYDHRRCIAGYMAGAMAFYRLGHLERGMGMIFKSIGLNPRGRMSAAAARFMYAGVRAKQWRYAKRVAAAA